MTRTNAPLTPQSGGRCQCPACGEVFSTDSGFTKHRKGELGKKYCVDPETVGLVIKKVGEYTVWKGKGSNSDWFKGAPLVGSTAA